MSGYVMLSMKSTDPLEGESDVVAADDVSLIDQYIDYLHANKAYGDFDSAEAIAAFFDPIAAVIDQLEADDRIDKAGMKLIAEAYTGGISFRTRGDAVRAIRDKLAEMRYLSGKALLNSGVTPW